MKIKLFILVFFLLSVSMTLNLSAATQDDFNEADTKFYYQGKPIHPGLVEEFSTWFSDSGNPSIITVDVSANNRNEYNDDNIKVEDNGWVCKLGENSSSFCYKWLGKLDNGIHVLQISESGGGSGDFGELYFVKLDKGKGYAADGKRYDQILMSVVRTYGLGDRDDGEIQVLLDKVIVGMGSSKYRNSSVVLEFKETDQDVEKRNKPEQIACTMEAKLCPDGSAVGRVGPNCQFAECSR